MPLPYVVLHNAVSIDGRIDGFPVDLGLFYGVTERWNEDAILTGSDTILAAEDPDEVVDLEVEPTYNRSLPLLVVVDSHARVRTWPSLRRQPYFRAGAAFCTTETPRAYLDYLANESVTTIISGSGHVDLRDALEQLHAHLHVDTVRVDSGGTLNAALLRAGVVDEVSLMIHPALVGNAPVRTVFPRLEGLSGDEAALGGQLLGAERVGDGVLWARWAFSPRAIERDAAATRAAAEAARANRPAPVSAATERRPLPRRRRRD
ncbi:MAG TPA: RibD family protein [Tepidiformaceae bacterium]|jgi:2,5-diamino-6-(ribosylamino)-4(3H)-pyrimidinone 5'-phosphate reductase|nr:RibD family protein [Tepidiformaceae bacterium]